MPAGQDSPSTIRLRSLRLALSLGLGRRGRAVERLDVRDRHSQACAEDAYLLYNSYAYVYIE